VIMKLAILFIRFCCCSIIKGKDGTYEKQCRGDLKLDVFNLGSVFAPARAVFHSEIVVSCS
jgi:hypothetical protein